MHHLNRATVSTAAIAFLAYLAGANHEAYGQSAVPLANASIGAQVLGRVRIHADLTVSIRVFHVDGGHPRSYFHRHAQREHGHADIFGPAHGSDADPKRGYSSGPGDSGEWAVHG